MIKKYKKRPIIQEGIQYTADSRDEIIEWLGDICKHSAIDDDGCPYQTAHLTIVTSEGDMRAQIGDFVMKDPHGNFYPVKEAIHPDLFYLVEE